MAIVQIPTRTDSDNYTLTVTLEGTAYDLTLEWSYRASCWTLSIAGVVDGLAVRVGYPLLVGVPTAGRPPGDLVAFDTAGQDLDPGLTDLGARVLLLYQESTG